LTAEGAKAVADAARMDATARENFILKYKCVGRMQNNLDAHDKLNVVDRLARNTFR
jgi:hypothetical protein